MRQRTDGDAEFNLVTPCGDSCSSTPRLAIRDVVCRGGATHLGPRDGALRLSIRYSMDELDQLSDVSRDSRRLSVSSNTDSLVGFVR